MTTTGKKAESRQQVYTRRDYIEYTLIMNGAPWAMAKEATASWAIENPDVDLDSEKLTWAEWQAEEQDRA